MGRNDPCPCGSGEKFKKCCGQVGGALPARDDPQVHFQLGHALHDQGDLAGAAASLRRALACKADFVEAHDSLGQVLHEAGHPAEAVASYRRALALRPDYAQAHGNLGNAFVDLGQLDDAVHHYRRMLELRPDMPEAHNNLGNALLALRQFEEAVTSYRRALELRPNSVGVLANLGNTLRELGRPQEALEFCRRALELQPDFAEGLRLKGNAQFDLGLLDEAAASYASALKLEPESVDAQLAVAKVLRQTGRVGEAGVSCRRALEMLPGSAQALALLGEIEADRGRFTEAQELFQRAISIAPELPEAWASLARYRKMGAQDAAWLAAAQRLVARSLPIGQEINLRYALGKYFDDVQDFAAAFAHYRAANELQKRGGRKHDRERFTRRVEHIRALYDQHWLSAVRAQGNNSGRPIFVVGMPRSGTTLIEQILASHPEVFGAGELRFWHTAAVSYESAAVREAGAPGMLPQLAREYLGLLAALSHDAPRVVDKMPANFLNLGLIHAAFPQARIIHMQRNPLDTGLSIYFQIFSNTHAYANDLEDIAHYFSQYLRVMQHWRATLPQDSMLEVSYEQLVEDPEPWIRKLVHFVGLPWDARCLQFHATERTVVTASNWQVRQKITKSSAGRWRNYEPFLGPLRALAAPEPAS